MNEGSMFLLNGIRVFIDHNMVDRKQFRTPRSKSKRILKKWMKQEKNYRTEPRKYAIKTEFGVVCHPDFYRMLQKYVDAKKTKPCFQAVSNWKYHPIINNNISILNCTLL